MNILQMTNAQLHGYESGLTYRLHVDVRFEK